MQPLTLHISRPTSKYVVSISGNLNNLVQHIEMPVISMVQCIYSIQFTTLPVTVASAKLSFWKLKIRQTYRRSSTSKDRLHGLALLAMLNECAKQLNIDYMIDTFASSKARMVQTAWMQCRVVAYRRQSDYIMLCYMVRYGVIWV